MFQRHHDQPPGSEVEEITWAIPLENDSSSACHLNGSNARSAAGAKFGAMDLWRGWWYRPREDEDELEDERTRSDRYRGLATTNLQALHESTIELLPEGVAITGGCSAKRQDGWPIAA